MSRRPPSRLLLLGAVGALGLAVAGCGQSSGAATDPDGSEAGAMAPVRAGATLLSAAPTASPSTSPSTSPSATVHAPGTTRPPVTAPAAARPTSSPPVTTSTTTSDTVPPVPSASITSTTTTTTTTTTTSTTAPPAPAWEAPPIGPRTSCRQVGHIGDSTSEQLWDPNAVGGDPAATMDARYREVGVEQVLDDSSGGRSTIERLDREQRNAIEVAQDLRASGFRGCWVLMIGTNDAANVAAGARTGLAERIESMLAVIDGDPVLWVNVSSSGTIPFYGAAEMAAFNVALAEAAARHPNLRVLDWAAVVQPDWYGPDDLHYGPTGRAWRTALTAQELARAFPG